MQTVTWIGLVAIAAVVGFFLGSWLTKKQLKQSELAQQAKEAQDALSQYRQDVADHLDSTNKLVDKMKDNYDQLASHVAQTNQLLLSDKKAEPTAEPFFSKETTEQLQASLNQRSERPPTHAIYDDQPADYAAGESGLFTEQVAKKESA